MKKKMLLGNRLPHVVAAKRHNTNNLSVIVASVNYNKSMQVKNKKAKRNGGKKKQTFVLIEKPHTRLIDRKQKPKPNPKTKHTLHTTFTLIIVVGQLA